MADARARFFAKMQREVAEQEGEGDNTIDIDFSVTESGRTVTHMMEESVRNASQGMDFSIVNSSRAPSIDLMGFSESERDDLLKTLQDPPVVAAIGGKAENVKTYAAKPRPIPLPNNNNNNKGTYSLQPPSQASSQGSSGSAFLSSVLNSTPGTFNNTQISHSPPKFGSSYEASHFGKRARSGSVSGRLLSASEYLEERGLLDRQTKDILKDLIIIGDEELQRAIDSYESGDPSQLEEMINSGALQNRLPSDLDILDDLDLDFLTMEGDVDGNVGAGGNIEPIRNSAHENTEEAYLPVHHAHSKLSAPNTTTLQLDQRPANVSPQYNDDGIGDLEFAGDLVSDLQLVQQSYAPRESSVAASPAEASNLSEYEQRLRSNSLFSALLNDPRVPPKPVTGHPVAGMSDEAQYGNWMERLGQETSTVQQQKVHQKTKGASRRASAPGAPSGIGASLEAERKRLEKLQKKESKEKAKQERKEKKEQEKRRLAEEAEEKHVHIPGSGMPRSLSDPNLRTSLDQDGLVEVERPDGWVGAYSPESRKVRIERFMRKRNYRVWTKTVKYDVRKNFADSRLRVKGRFVKKEDEVLMRELMSLT